MVRGLLAAAAFGVLSVAAHAQVKIGVISSSTGPISVIGIQQKNTVDLLPKRVGDYDVSYVFLDDGSDPTQSVKNVQKLIIEEKVDAIIGPSGSPNAVAVVSFIAEAKTPLLAPVGTSAVVLPMDAQKRWVFKTTQNDNLVMDAIFAQMKKDGVKTLAFIGTSDPLGESFERVAKATAEKAGVKFVASERFARSDASVTGQSLKILSLSPDAVLIGTAGAPTVLPEVALIDQGYKGKLYQTHGAATPEFLKLGGKKVEGTRLAASPMLVLKDVGDDVASKQVALKYIGEYKAKYGSEPGTFGSNVYDAGILLANAIPQAGAKAKPGTPEFRSALRDALEATKDVVGAQGVYNMTADDHSGFDSRSIVPIIVKNNQWSLLK